MMTSRNLERERVWDQIICTQEMATHHSLSVKEVNYLFPLYLYHGTPISALPSDAPVR
ncbi:MAG: hypothetical protein J4G17_04705 [Anaerolineae bacterium]|nr:hypothetical protein [Anaerolineae bacterium]